MKVLIEDNLYIEGDHQNIEIRKYTGKKDNKGNDLYKTLGYFPTVEKAVEKVYHNKLAESKTSIFEEFLDEVKDVRRWLNEIMGYKG